MHKDFLFAIYFSLRQFLVHLFYSNYSNISFRSVVFVLFWHVGWCNIYERENSWAFRHMSLWSFTKDLLVASSDQNSEVEVSYFWLNNGRKVRLEVRRSWARLLFGVCSLIWWSFDRPLRMYLDCPCQVGPLVPVSHVALFSFLFHFSLVEMTFQCTLTVRKHNTTLHNQKESVEAV